MEDHLKNKDRLLKEWEALCSYQAEPSTISAAHSENNMKKNRCSDAVPCELNLLLHCTSKYLRFLCNSVFLLIFLSPKPLALYF